MQPNDELPRHQGEYDSGRDGDAPPEGRRVSSTEDVRVLDALTAG